jgi:uncharacterized protein
MAKRKTKSPRRDAWTNSETGHGTSRDATEYTYFTSRPVSDEYAIQLWRSDDMIKKIVEALPTDALRRPWTYKIGDGDGEDKEKAADLSSENERLDGVQTFKRAICTERATGGAIVFPVMEGGGPLEEPLEDYEDRIGKIIALHCFEPRECVPATWYTKLSDVKFRQPRTWRISPLSGNTGRYMVGEEIHESRLIVFPGRRVSNQPLTGQRTGHGDGVVQYCLKVVSDYGLSWGSVAKLLTDFGHGVYKLDQLDEILAEKNGEAELDRRLEAMDRRKSSLRAAVIGKNDEFMRVATALGGYAEVLIQIAQRLAACAEMPMTRLFGMSPAGLNATGESDIRMWYDSCEQERERHAHRIDQYSRMLMLQNDGPFGGVEPDDWDHEFPPLWQPSEKEQAETRKLVAETDQIYFTIGSASNDDIAISRWGSGRYSMEMAIDWAAREEAKRLEEEQAQEMHDAQVEATANPPPPGSDPNAAKTPPQDEGDEKSSAEE